MPASRSSLSSTFVGLIRIESVYREAAMVGVAAAAARQASREELESHNRFLVPNRARHCGMAAKLHLRLRMRLAVEVVRTLEAYLSAQIRISLILALLYAVAFAFLGVPAWPFVALLGGFLQAVPIVGSVIALLVPAALTWIDGGGFYRVLGVFGVWLVGQALEGFYLTPRIMGRRLHLPPLTVFAGLIFGGALFGFFGVLLAVPAMAVTVAVWRYMKKRDTPELPAGSGSRSDRNRGDRVLPSHLQDDFVASRRLE